MHVKYPTLKTIALWIQLFNLYLLIHLHQKGLPEMKIVAGLPNLQVNTAGSTGIQEI